MKFEGTGFFRKEKIAYYHGWFLFGLIPLYIRRSRWYGLDEEKRNV